MSDYDDLFDADGDLDIPTMRGEANLDIEDYERVGGPDDDSSILDDDLEEDTPSRPGAGAGPATDIDGTDEYDTLEGNMEDPGMKQTEYGASPWGPGSSAGYRPHSQAMTDMELRALGEDETRQPRRMEPDSMHHEPEVINAAEAEHPESWKKQWHGNRNQMPSNAGIDPETLYDRDSYEWGDDSSQATIGSGIFEVEEGVTWRARDGIFATDYAEPAYIAQEDELGVQQSEMFDSTANNWRVTQPSAGGVTLKRRVPALKPLPPMRPEVTGPRSHVEAFGRKAAKIVIGESKAFSPQQRSAFLTAAIESLGTGTAGRCKAVADRLIQMGYPAETAFEDALAHCVMHAAVNDLRSARRTSNLPRLDALAARMGRGTSSMRQAAVQHLGPLTSDTRKLRSDLGALFGSPAGRGMGQVTEPATPPAPAPAAESVFRPRNLLIAGGLGVAGYFLFANRKKIVKNVKKWMG